MARKAKAKAVVADVAEDSTEAPLDVAGMVYLSHRETYPLVLPMGGRTVKVPAGEEVAIDAEVFAAQKHSHGVHVLLVRGTLIARQAVV